MYSFTDFKAILSLERTPSLLTSAAFFFDKSAFFFDLDFDYDFLFSFLFLELLFSMCCYLASNKFFLEAVSWW